MIEIFKQNLLRLRKPKPPQTFAEALMGETPWMSPKRRVEERPKDTVLHTEMSKPEEAPSLEQVRELKTQKHHSTESLLQGLSLSREILEQNLKRKTLGQVKVIFVSEKFRTWQEIAPELKSGFLNELLAAFVPKTAELFERMIMAMKLTPDEVIIYPVEGDDQDLTNEVMQIAEYFKPEVIITLGAKATQKILNGQDRLSLIHGQFFTRKGELAESFNIVPLFHPSIIETNQNMKKTAWADMQKIMKHLKKLP